MKSTLAYASASALLLLTAIGALIAVTDCGDDCGDTVTIAVTVH